MKKKKKIVESSIKRVSEIDGNFDNVPDSIYNTQSGYPSPENPGLSSTLYEDEAEPEEGETGEEIPAPSGPLGDEEPQPPIEDEGGEEETVDELQNQIIKYNVEMLKTINNDLKDLKSSIDYLNSRYDQLHSDVEEVREPTNVEKLERKKDVSYPYYFQLNEFWKDNWFQKRNGGTSSNFEDEITGMRKLPDGTYIADLDDLPEKSHIDIEKSFHDVI
ncbi:MAG: hypothetical protein ACOC2U_05295 [bacterium]